MNGISYLPRLLDSQIAELFAQLPALLLTGPRASGKTTTARRQAKTTVRLDQPNQAAALRADVDSALRAFIEPVLIDEWQLVPDVLAAIKRAVDDDPRAGRFLLTGSVNADLNTATWPGTGRVVRLPMYGLTTGEITASNMTGNNSFLARLSTGDLEAFAAPPAIPDLRDYLEFARNSGFPDARGDVPTVLRAGISSAGWSTRSRSPSCALCWPYLTSLHGCTTCGTRTVHTR